jgi:serine/threonine-protein kinase
MSDDDAFLRAIADAPDDDAPRLVYADWLDEHGQPDRAEFIRLLCSGEEPAVLERLREVAPSLDSTWAARVSPEFPRVHPIYVVIREVARGALTTVLEATATHPKMRGRRVAVRTLNDGQSARRFANTCQIHAALGDELQVPRLFDVGELEHIPYAIRKFIDGDDLLNNIRGRTVAPDDLVRIVTTVATILNAMHRLGVIHGTVHPRHLLQDRDGAVWVIGFGEMPPAGLVMGNPLHLALEQFDRWTGPVGPATDVYQLAETAAWLLAGRHPYQDFRPPDDLLAAKRSEDGWRTGALRNLSEPVAAVFRRALAPDPAVRYPTAGEFAAALANAFQERPRSRWRFW